MSAPDGWRDDGHPAEGTLHDLADGLLPEEERARVEAHAAGCLACRRELAAIRSLVADLAETPREVPPARDLFPGIAGRIAGAPGAGGARDAGAAPAADDALGPLDAAAAGSPGERRPASRYRLAAAAVALVAVSSLVTATVLDRRSGPEGTTGRRAVETDAVLAADHGRVEEEYAGAIRQVVEALDGRRERLSPETVRILEESLAVIDRALEEARSALAEDPGNPMLRELMVTAYEQKLDLLRRAAGVATEG